MRIIKREKGNTEAIRLSDQKKHRNIWRNRKLQILEADTIVI